jgi:hypothetical protein
MNKANNRSRLERLKQLAANASTDSWQIQLDRHDNPRVYSGRTLVATIGNAAIEDSDQWEDNARFIAACHQDVPWLIEHLDMECKMRKRAEQESESYLEAFEAVKHRLGVEHEIAEDPQYLVRALENFLAAQTDRTRLLEEQNAKLVSALTKITKFVMGVRGEFEAVVKSVRETVGGPAAAPAPLAAVPAAEPERRDRKIRDFPRRVAAVDKSAAA